MRPGKPRSPVLEHIEERGDLRSVPGWECPGNGDVGRTATPAVRRELTVQAVGQFSRAGYGLLHRTGEVPAEAGPRRGGQFRTSHRSRTLYFRFAATPPCGSASRHCHDCTPTRSPRRPDCIGAPRDDSSFLSSRAKNGRVPIHLSLRAKRGNLYNDVDHSRPWCIPHEGGAGRSWVISETSKTCLR